EMGRGGGEQGRGRVRLLSGGVGGAWSWRNFQQLRKWIGSRRMRDPVNNDRETSRSRQAAGRQCGGRNERVNAGGKTCGDAASGMTAGQYAGIDLFELRQGGLPVAGILDHILGLLAFSFHGELTFLSEPQIVAAPATTLRDTRQTLVGWRINKYDCVTHTLPTRLEQQRRVEHDRFDIGARLRLSDVTRQYLRNPGVDNLFQFLEGGLVLWPGAEDQLLHSTPIDLAPGSEDGVAECLSHALLD